jgi:hypothetical protein
MFHVWPMATLCFYVRYEPFDDTRQAMSSNLSSSSSKLLFCELNFESPTKPWNTVLTIFLSIYFYFPPSTKLRGNFKTVPLCNYTLLPATVKLLETFLEATFWKPFQLFRRILNYVSSITKVPSLQCWLQSKEQVKISCSQVRKIWRMFQFCDAVLC